jgi:hypothetical protein
MPMAGHLIMANGEIHASLGWSFPESHTLIQLVNKDGDCFINSILQALYNLGPVQEYIWKCQDVFERDNLTWRTEQSVFGFFVRIYVDSIRAPQNEVWYEPNYFLDRVFAEGVFRRGIPADAYEFFMFLVTWLDREVDVLNTEHGRELFHPFMDVFRIVAERQYTEPDGEFFTVEDTFLSCLLPPSESISAGLARWMDSYLKDGAHSVRTFVNLPRVLACQPGTMIICASAAAGATVPR